MAHARILIAGAGIGGLALALALRRHGFEPVVVERAPDLQPVGAGTVLSPAAVAALAALGVDLSRAGREVERMLLTDQAGRRLSTSDLGAIRALFGPAYALHRGELHAALRAAWDGELRLGAPLKSLSQNAAVAFAQVGDEREESWDLVVGADGIRSRAREALFPGSSPRYAGYTCWRFVTPVACENQDPLEMWGRGQRVGFVPLNGGRTYVFATHNAPAGAADPLEGRKERAAERFAQFRGFSALIAPLRDEDLLHNDLEEVVLPRWTEGRVALLGDAAHASTPNLGLGATLAIEDAWVLAQKLGALGATPEALTAFEAARRRRALAVQRESRLLGVVGQLANPVACRVRDALVRATPEKAMARTTFKATVGEPALDVLRRPPAPAEDPRPAA